MSLFSKSLITDELSKASSKHKFIELISTGQVSQDQFNLWLSQDYLFVLNYIHFVAKVFNNAPRKDYKLLINSLSALEEELTWFEKKLKEKNILTTNLKPLSTNLNYQQCLNELIQTNKSYFSLITTIYAVELCYYEAWKSVQNSDYQEYANRWGSTQFGQFIEQLQQAVDHVSTTASDNDKKQVHELWDKIMQYEISFWDMALNNSSNL